MREICSSSHVSMRLHSWHSHQLRETWQVCEFRTLPNFKYGMILPIATSSYLSKTYQVTFFNLFKNILGKLNPLAHFSVLLYHMTDYFRLLHKMTFFYGIVEEEKINVSSNIWHNLNGKTISTVNVKMITLKNLVPKKISSPFKKTHCFTILPPTFYNLLDSPSEWCKQNLLPSFYVSIIHLLKTNFTLAIHFIFQKTGIPLGSIWVTVICFNF